MEVSVLIATLGSERLEEIARAYLQQSVTDVEVVVVVDNASVDRTALLASLRSDTRLKIIFNDANMGLTKSLNRGLDQCCGELVLRNDDDDLPDPDRVRKTVEFFRSHPTCDIAYAYARGVDARSGRSWIISGPVSDMEIKAHLLQRNFIAHSSLAVRTARLKAIGGYDATFRYAQDYDLYLRCIRAGLQFGCIPDVLVERYYHEGSITVKLRRTQILCSFAARLIHDAEVGADYRHWKTVLGYITLLAIPNALRTLRRGTGYGR